MVGLVVAPRDREGTRDVGVVAVKPANVEKGGVQLRPKQEVLLAPKRGTLASASPIGSACRVVLRPFGLTGNIVKLNRLIQERSARRASRRRLSDRVVAAYTRVRKPPGV